MQTSVPALPTALPEVEVTTTARRTTPLAVVCRSGEAAPTSLSARGEELSDEWVSAVALTGSGQ